MDISIARIVLRAMEKNKDVDNVLGLDSRSGDSFSRRSVR